MWRAMKKSTLLALGSIVGIGLAFALGASLPRVATAQPTTRNGLRATAGSPPAALVGTARSSRYTAALSAAKLAGPKATIGSGIKLTPNTPRHSSGAYFSGADIVVFDGDSNAYIGSVGAFGSPGNNPIEQYMYVTGSFPTTVGALYVYDCAIVKANVPGAKIDIKKNGSNDAPMNFADGHALWAFNATDTKTTLSVIVWGISQTSRPELHSCELTKVD